mgnify:CR=1 FL=1
MFDIILSQLSSLRHGGTTLRTCTQVFLLIKKNYCKLLGAREKEKRRERFYYHLLRSKSENVFQNSSEYFTNFIQKEGYFHNNNYLRKHSSDKNSKFDYLFSIAKDSPKILNSINLKCFSVLFNEARD